MGLAMVNDLFNPKTVKRLCSKVSLSPKQKKAAREWLELLEQGKLKEERPNYLKFVKIVLNDLLGYGIREILHEESNIEFSFPDTSGRKVLGIEVKGTKTKDLFSKQGGREEQETTIQQLWRYMGDSNFDYGIATNYKEFILIDRFRGTSHYYEMNFEEVRGDEQKLKEFVAIFSKDQIIDKKFIEKLGKESSVEEREFTKEFYKLFHETRLMLVEEFEANGASRAEAVHYAQLFLNRLMFIFFAEDTGKLDKRLFEDLVVSALSAEMLISDHSKIVSTKITELFRSLDEGSTIPTRIFGFNGGLFKEKIPSDVYFKDMRDKKFFEDIYQYSKLKKEYELDAVSKPVFKKYGDKLNPIIKNLLLMVLFDFSTEVSINILGHIFEQSLTDLEDLKAGKAKKRKKEGIYYTPEHITRYICENTIIPYLSRKGTAISARALVLEYAKNIKELETKFKNIKILDPACGSGAFLIQAVDVLLDIHKEIRLFKQNEGEYTAIKRGRKRKKDPGQLTLLKWKEEDEAREIIENNIFGVDINEESVEITKLSMFLKIAKKNRKLIDLSRNIKCGNSLVSDNSLDLRGFDWEETFKEVFAEGGFDVILGNPPYVSQKGTSENPNIAYREREYYRNNYSTLSQGELHTRGGVKLNLFALWIERAFTLLRPRGLIGFIVHKNLLKVESYKFLRKYLLDNSTIQEVFDLGRGIFENVVGETIILRILKQNPKSNRVCVKENVDLARGVFRTHTVSQDVFGENPDYLFNIYEDENLARLKRKMSKCSINLEEGYDIVSFGLDTNNNKKWFSSEFVPGWKKAVMGRHVSRWRVKAYGYVNYDNSVLTRKGDVSSFEQKEKLILQRISSGLVVAYDDNQLYCYNSTNMILRKSSEYDLRYLLCLLNSRLINYYYINVFSMKSGLTVNVTQGYLSQIPIKELSLGEQKYFVKLAEELIQLYDSFHSSKKKFLSRLIGNFEEVRVSKKLEHFYTLNFAEFLKEVRKNSVSLSLREQDAWEDYFNRYKILLSDLLVRISTLDEAVNERVYDVYGITKDERKKIEETLA